MIAIAAPCLTSDVKVEVSMNFSNAKMMACSVLIALIACVGFIYFVWQNHLWKLKVRDLAAYQGVSRAKEDFRAGKLRLFLVDHDESSSVTFRGSNNGPFKVALFSAYPFDSPCRYAALQVVEFYNQSMKAFHEHPERWVTTNAEGRVGWK